MRLPHTANFRLAHMICDFIQDSALPALGLSSNERSAHVLFVFCERSAALYEKKNVGTGVYIQPPPAVLHMNLNGDVGVVPAKEGT